MVYCDKIEVAEPLDNIGRLEISTMSEDLFLEVNLETALLAGKLTLERKRNEVSLPSALLIHVNRLTGGRKTHCERMFDIARLVGTTAVEQSGTLLPPVSTLLPISQTGG